MAHKKVDERGHDGASHDGPSGVVTVVLRLLRRPLGRGELVGRAEIVATGEIGDVHGVEDIVRLASPSE